MSTSTANRVEPLRTRRGSCLVKGIISMGLAFLPALGFGQTSQMVSEEGQRAQIDEIVNRLMTLQDLGERRDLRQQLAQRKPSAIVLLTLVARYSSSDPALKNQIESIIGEMDFEAEVASAFQAASKIGNTDLFVSVAYALGNSTSPDARRLVLQLLDENNVLKDDASQREVQAVVTRVFLDNFKTNLDAPWLVEKWDSGILSSEQQNVGVKAALIHSAPASLPILQRARRISRTDAERVNIDRAIAIIEEQASQK